MTRNLIVLIPGVLLLACCQPAYLEPVVYRQEGAASTVAPGVDMGPDFNATRAYYEIQASADKAAGELAFRMAGESELTRQAALSTVQALEAEIRLTQSAELHQIEAEATRQALVLASGADRATATRSAVLAVTRQAQEDAESAHAALIRSQGREAERRTAQMRTWLRPLQSAIVPLLLFGFTFAGVGLIVKVVLARNLAQDLAEVIGSFTGHFLPLTIEGEVAGDWPDLPGGSRPILGTHAADKEVVELLAFALKADSYAYHQIRAAGWAHGARTWQRLLERLQGDGWTVVIDAGKPSQRYIEAPNRSRLDALWAYGGAIEQLPTRAGVHRTP